MRHALQPFALAVLVVSFATAAQQPIDQALAAFAAGDYEKALKLAKPLAEKGQREALVILGQLHEKGRAVPRDPAAALRYYRQASARQSAAGRYHLARAYRDGIGTAADPERAARLCRSAAESDYPPAQALLGLMYSRGEGVPRDYPQAVRWYEKAAAAGEAEAQYSLGFMYSSGVGLPKQLPNAARWLRRAAAQGHGQAEYLLGVMLVGPAEGMTRDLVEAYALLVLAGEHGVQEARAKTAELRERMTPAELTEASRRARAVAEELAAARSGRRRGRKGPPAPHEPVEEARAAFDSGKHARARRVAEPLAEGGDPEAQYLMGLLCERGWGGAKDIPRALDYARRSAEGGYPPAMFNLGVIYETGRPSVSADPVEAYKWYAVASAYGDADAFDKTKSLAARIREDQLTEARNRAKQWILDHARKGRPPASKANGEAFQEFK